MPRSRLRRCRRALAAVAMLVVLASCRIDATVDVVLQDDGSGTVTVTVVADAEVVESAPGLAADIRVDDLTAAGWVAEGPSPTEGGGLSLVLAHPFSTPAEATALLAQLSDQGGPFRDLLVDQTRSFARLTSAVTGTIVLAGGLSTFADAAVIELIGGEPYAQTLAERGIAPEDTFRLRLVVTAPGELVESTGAVTSDGGATTASWDAGFSGPAATEDGIPVVLRTVEADRVADWASRLEAFAPWAAAAWGVFMVGVVVPIVALRRRRR